MIRIQFDKLYSTKRPNEHSSIAIPFAKGICADANDIYVIQNNQMLPTQHKVTSRWDDGSVRWLHTHFMASLPANAKTDCWMVTGKELDGMGLSASDFLFAGIRLYRESHKITVNTGALQFCVTDGANCLMEEVTAGNTDFANYYFPLPQLSEYTTDGSTGDFSSAISSWNVLEEGPLVCILEGLGEHRADNAKKLAMTIRITVYAQKPWMEVEYRIVNTTYDELRIKSLVLTASESTWDTGSDRISVRTCASRSNYQTICQTSLCGETMEQVIDSHLLLYEANEHFSEVFYGTLFCDRTTSMNGLCATVYQGQQNYPKAVIAHRDKLQVFLVPESDDRVVMQSGMARSQRVLLHFHGSNEGLESLNNRSTIYQMPDHCRIDAQVFQNAGVLEDVFSSKKSADLECLLSTKGDAHSRCYGMMNWGDSPDPGYTLQGRGGDEPVWTNNEYDFPHACYLMYARTGLRRFLDYGLVSSDHWMDVDVCHFSDDPLLFQGQWEHTNGHCKNGSIICSHQWVEGLLDTWHFTGNERALETALGIGDNILRLLDTPIFHQKGGINARETGWALRSLSALYKETGNQKWLKKCDWIVGHFREWKAEYGQWLSPYLDNVAIHVVFMISIAVGSLMRYYRINPQEEIKSMIVDAVDDMIENCMLDDGTFYYKELPSLCRTGTNLLILEALQNAYELTGDSKYLEPGLVTYRNALKASSKTSVSGKKHVGDSVINQGPGTKDFAQSFLPLALYYKAAVDTGLL